jgi:hypothetical protein
MCAGAQSACAFPCSFNSDHIASGDEWLQWLRFIIGFKSLSGCSRIWRKRASDPFETMHMRHLRTLVFLATFLPSSPWISAAAAEPARPVATLNLAQAERMAADLKQGMKLEDVQKLLGKPRRTALRHDGSPSNTPSQSTLQWTYSWGSSSQGSLQIEFAAKAPEDWYVNSWQWATY